MPHQPERTAPVALQVAALDLVMRPEEGQVAGCGAVQDLLRGHAKVDRQRPQITKLRAQQQYAVHYQDGARGYLGIGAAHAISAVVVARGLHMWCAGPEGHQASGQQDPVARTG